MAASLVLSLSRRKTRRHIARVAKMRATRSPPAFVGEGREGGSDRAPGGKLACADSKRRLACLFGLRRRRDAVPVSYPSPCPSPTKGGGNDVACSAYLRTFIRVAHPV